MFSDYECPFCGRFENEIFPEIRRDFVDNDLVNVAFWNFPLDIHPMAVRAAEAGECAGAQGKFWPMHYRLFADPKKLEMPDLLAAAESAGVATAAFAECLSEKRMLAGVKSDKAVGEALGINSTPAFLIGTVRDNSLAVSATVKGARPYADFKASLEKALAEAR
jgi:protein-disulfide isomerase